MLYNSKLFQLVDEECTKMNIRSLSFRKLYLAITILARRCSKDDTKMKGHRYCFAHNDYLMKEAGVRESQLRSHLSKMEKLGWICREMSYRVKRTTYKRKKDKVEVISTRKIFPLFGINK